MINLPKFSRFVLEAGGESAGNGEVDNTSLEHARELISRDLMTLGLTLDSIPTFDDNYMLLKKSVEHGFETRKVMPVVSAKQVKLLKDSLLDGDVDILKPFNLKFKDYTKGDADLEKSDTNTKTEYRFAGKFDGNLKDDVISATYEYVKVSKLLPVQKQIYLSKFLKNVSKYGIIDNNTKMLQKSLIVSRNYELIDGHHRWMSIMLCNPELKVKILRVHLETIPVLKVVKNFGISLGNQSNE
jgi:hypothetical protein